MRGALAAAALIIVSLLFPASSVWAASQAKGKLTLDTESSDVWFSVKVKGASAPAPSSLADAAGQHVAHVAGILGACPARVQATQRDIGLTGPAWCVHVSGLQAGYSVSGTLASPSTSLSLTVRRKDTPGWPLAWSIIALLAAVVISWLSSTYVPGLTSQLRRRWYERANVPVGVGAWVKRAAKSGVLADDDIVARAKWAKKGGIDQVKKARKQLKQALPGTVSWLAGSPLRQDCETEAKRDETDVNCEDLLTDEGAKSIKAVTLLETLTKADNAIRDFETSANLIIADLSDPSQERKNATQSRDNTLKQAEGLSDQGVPQFVETLSNVIAAMLTSAGAPAAAPVAAAAISGTAVRSAAAEIATSVKETLWPALIYLPAVLVAFAVMAGAVATVFAAQYLANPSFGTTTNYLTLILSAYGSAQVTAIVAALLLMHPPKPWYG